MVHRTSLFLWIEMGRSVAPCFSRQRDLTGAPDQPFSKEQKSQWTNHEMNETAQVTRTQAPWEQQRCRCMRWWSTYWRKWFTVVGQSSHCWTCRAAASHNTGKTKVKAMCYLFSFSEALQCSRRNRHVFFSICLSGQRLNAGMWKYVSDPKGATTLKNALVCWPGANGFVPRISDCIVAGDRGIEHVVQHSIAISNRTCTQALVTVEWEAFRVRGPTV